MLKPKVTFFTEKACKNLLHALANLAIRSNNADIKKAGQRKNGLSADDDKKLIASDMVSIFLTTCIKPLYNAREAVLLVETSLEGYEEKIKQAMKTNGFVGELPEAKIKDFILDCSSTEEAVFRAIGSNTLVFQLSLKNGEGNLNLYKNEKKEKSYKPEKGYNISSGSNDLQYAIGDRISPIKRHVNRDFANLKLPKHFSLKDLHASIFETAFSKLLEFETKYGISTKADIHAVKMLDAAILIYIDQFTLSEKKIFGRNKLVLEGKNHEESNKLREEKNVLPKVQFSQDELLDVEKQPVNIEFADLTVGEAKYIKARLDQWADGKDLKYKNEDMKENPFKIASYRDETMGNLVYFSVKLPDRTHSREVFDLIKQSLQEVGTQVSHLEKVEIVNPVIEAVKKTINLNLN